VNYAFSAIETHNLVMFFATLGLVGLAAAALTPWEDSWQAGLNLICLLAWMLTAQIIPHAGLDLADMSLVLIAAAAIGQFTVRLRQRFTTDNLVARYKFKDSEARLRKILNAGPDLGKIFDASIDSMILSDGTTGVVIDINREFSRLSGYSREDAIGRDIRDLRLFNDHAKASEFARSLRATNEARNIEDLLRTKSGALVPCLLSGALIDFGGRKCCLATTRDVTELKRTQHRLEKSERRFQTIFAAMPGSTSIINSKGKFIGVSKPLSASGLTRDEIVGHTPDEIGFWADPAERTEFNRLFQRDGSVNGMEVHMRCKDGTNVPVLLSVTPLDMDDERCFITMTHDITALSTLSARPCRVRPRSARSSRRAVTL
jgi:PAS domain S-box-containing protein